MILTTTLSLLMGASGGEGQTSPLAALLPILLIFAIMYFFMIRPQVKKQKSHQAMIASLNKGDKVVTTGGIMGKIVGVKDNSFFVQIADNTKIEILKTAVASKME